MWCINSRHLPKFLMNMSGLGRNANIFKYSKVESGNWIKFQFEREWIWVGEKQSQKIVTSAFCLFLSCWPRSLVSLYLCPPQCLGLSYLYCLVCHQTLHHRPLVFSPFPRNIANKLPKNAEGNWLKKSQTLPNFSHTSTRPHPTQYWLRQLRSKDGRSPQSVSTFDSGASMEGPQIGCDAPPVSLADPSPSLFLLAHRAAPDI